MAAPLVARILVEHAGGAAALPAGGGGTPPPAPEGKHLVLPSGEKHMIPIAAAAEAGADETKKNTSTMRSIGDKARSFQEKTSGYAKGQLSKTLGMSVGIASILKQSQVFTGYVGTIFQLLGALVDVILAPFLPILIPAIRMIASMIPIIGQYSKSVFNFLNATLFSFFKWVGGFLPKGVGNVMKKIIAGLVLGLFFAKIFGIGKAFFGGTKTATIGTYSVLKAILSMARGRSLAVRDYSIGKAMGVQGGAAKGRHLKMMRMGGARNLLLMSGFGLIGRAFTSMGTILKGGFNLLRGGQGLQAGATTKLVPEMASNAGRTANIFSRMGTGIMTGLRASRGFIGGLIRTGWANFATKFPRLASAMVNVKGAIVRQVGRAWRGITGLPGKIATQLGPHLEGLTAGLRTLATKFAASTAGRGILGAARGIGNVFKNQISKVLPKAGFANLAKGAFSMSRAIPVLGAVAEVAYGGYKTYKSFKDYGAKAGFARLGATAALATGAFFDPTGIASAGASIGGHMALDYAEKKGVFGEFKGEKDVVVNNNLTVVQQTTEGLDVNSTQYQNQSRAKEADARSELLIPAAVVD